MPGDGDRLALTPKTVDTRDSGANSSALQRHSGGAEKGQGTHGKKPKDHDTKIRVIGVTENPKVIGEIIKGKTQELKPRAHSTGGRSQEEMARL